MAAVMIKAVSFVEEKEVHLEEIISRLKIENQVITIINIYYCVYLKLIQLYSLQLLFILGIERNACHIV